MRWSDIPFSPSQRTLRQFSGMWIGFFSMAGTATEFPGSAIAVAAFALPVAGPWEAKVTLMAFAPGDCLYADAGEVHRFEDFTDDLAVWVVFWGPEGGHR